MDFWGTLASDIQADVTVSGDTINGKLTKLKSGQLVTDWGEGYFIGLAFDDFSEGLTYEDVKVGLMPSDGSGLVTLDSDKIGVFKVTDKNTQKLAVVQTSETGQRTQLFDLSNLVLLEG